MFIVIDCDTLLTQSGEPLPGAIEKMRDINEVDQLVYISSKNISALNTQMKRLGFPAGQSFISCQNDSDKLLTILSYILSPNERITFISTVQVLKSLDMDRIWRERPQAATTLPSRFTFIICGVRQIKRNLLSYIEFPVEALPSWQENAITAEM